MPHIVISPSLRRLPDNLTEDVWVDALTRAARAWSYPQVPCTSLEISVGPVVDRRTSDHDGLSLAVFRPGPWCHNERCDRDNTFPRLAAAMTTTHPRGAVGASITEGDIELNAAHWSFPLRHTVSLPPGPSPPALPPLSVPLDVVLMHEVGHLAGMRDVCSSHGALSKAAIASCAERDSIMFAPGQNQKLSPGDIRELCAIHPGVVEASAAHATVVHPAPIDDEQVLLQSAAAAPQTPNADVSNVLLPTTVGFVLLGFGIWRRRRRMCAPSD